MTVAVYLRNGLQRFHLCEQHSQPVFHFFFAFFAALAGFVRGLAFRWRRQHRATALARATAALVFLLELLRLTRVDHEAVVVEKLLALRNVAQRVHEHVTVDSSASQFGAHEWLIQRALLPFTLPSITLPLSSAK